MQQLPMRLAVQLAHHVAIRQNKPVMFWGQPGSGKTAGTRAMTTEIGAYLVTILLSQYEAIDLRGLPNLDGILTRWCMPSTLPFIGNPAFAHIPDDQIIVLFLDELPQAAPTVQSAAFQLVLERRIGEHVLRPNVRIIAAGNRQSDRAGANRMATPLANRFVHVEVVPEVETFTRVMAGKVPPEGIAFLNFRKDLLSTFEVAGGGVTTDLAFATLRSWETALTIYADPDPAFTPVLKEAAMAGTVGNGPSAEFWAFITVWQNVTPFKDILANPRGVPIPSELSMLYAQIVAVSGHMTAANADTVQQYIARFPVLYQQLAWQLACKRDRSVMQTNAFVAMAQTGADLYI